MSGLKFPKDTDETQEDSRDNRVFALSDFCYFSDNFPPKGTIYQKSVSEY